MGESGILLLIFLLLLGAILAVSIVLIRKAERERDEALQHVADARTDFLSRISNDIKTPMNVIMGMTAVGLEESDHPEKMVECLGKIDTASRFLMGLLNDLVDVSMIELGRFRLHPKPYAGHDRAGVRQKGDHILHVRRREQSECHGGSDPAGAALF